MISMHRYLELLLVVVAAGMLRAADYPPPIEGEYTLRDFKFASGETLPELRMHYRALGRREKTADGKTNVVLIMHGTTGSGAQFIRPEFAGELFGKGQPLDATKFFIVLPDGIGHGKSSKPSDDMHAKFPRYGYNDMIEAQYRLLTEGLGVNHARLVMGTSMGGMHTWLWGESHPDFMEDRKSTRLNSSHLVISYAVFCLKKKKYIIYILSFYVRYHVDRTHRLR